MGKENVVHTYNRHLFTDKEGQNLSYAGKWMELETIIWSKISHLKREVLYVFSHMWKLGNRETGKRRNSEIRRETSRVDEGDKGEGVKIKFFLCMHKYATVKPTILYKHTHTQIAPLPLVFCKSLL